MIVLKADDKPGHDAGLFKRPGFSISKDHFLFSHQMELWIKITFSFYFTLMMRIPSHFLIICAINFYSLSPTFLVFKENGHFQRIFETFTGHLQHSWGYLKQKTNTAKNTLSCFLIMPTLGLTVFLEKPSRMTGFFLVSHCFLLSVNFFYWVISITTRKQNSSSITTKSQSVPLTCPPHVMINTDN